MWHANEVQEQLKTCSACEVNVDVLGAIVKAKSLQWFISTWESLRARPEIIINGLKKAGILDGVESVLSL